MQKISVKYRVGWSFALVLTSLGAPAFAQPVNVPLQPITNYQLEDRMPLEQRMNCMVFTGTQYFNKAFGILKTMPVKPNAPDFNKELVLVIAKEPTTTETTLKFDHAKKAGNFIEVYCSQKTTIPITYTMRPIALVKIPKYPEVKLIKFYEGTRLVKEIKIK